MARFPFGIPNSWYLVAFSDEIDADTLTPLPYLGRNMIGFRGEDGEVAVLDGWCPHLGASLAAGGTCEGGTIRCPFHGWRFDAAGECVDVPYARRIPPSARLTKYPVLERNGMVFVWGGDEAVAPFFEIPVIPEWEDPAWTDRWMRFEWTVATHPQEISENGVDSPHLHTVHLMEPVQDFQLRFEGPAYIWNIGVSKEFQTMPEYRDGFTMKGENWGLGYSLIRQQGQHNTVVITSFTAVDAENTCIKMAVIAEHGDREDAAVQAELEGYMKEHGKVAEQDFEIWKHKRYEPRPILCDGDGPIAEHRKWATQFYPQAP